MSNQLSVFSFEGSDIRTTDENGEVWFIGKDIAALLGYTDTVNAIKKHCRGVAKYHPISDSLGRQQEVRVISEPDLYRLVMSSKLPAAERFERWVFEEVLPQIRKTGKYLSKNTLEQPLLDLKSAIGIAEALGLEGTQAKLSANNAVKQLHGVDCLELLGSTGLIAERQEMHYPITKFAKELGLSARKANSLLEAAGVLKRGVDHKGRREWEFTEAGKRHGIYQDTGRRNSIGAPVLQIRWYESIRSVIKSMMEGA